ncbi:toll/interleukin-1 receptor domain-containing protein [Cryptosporangium japonicum]|uniref:toll/interleukin-1 receptor domain-containing protein n=1 Tax=Cryptosporangium japonicum TaxID=80872 RepID=UPI0031D68F2C
MTGIFINYRTDDDGFAAALVDKRLCDLYGPDQVFRDCRSLRAGDDFSPELWHRLLTSDVVLVLIGRQWLTLTTDAGQRRIDNPDDYVRREIVEALDRGKAVVPILLNDAELPLAGEIPVDVRPLISRQFVRLRVRYAEMDLDHLFAELEDRIGPGEAAVPQPGGPPVHFAQGGTYIGGSATVHGGVVGRDRIDGDPRRSRSGS